MMTTKRMLTLLAAGACRGGEGGPPSAEPGQGATADSAQKDNTGSEGAHTGG